MLAQIITIMEKFLAENLVLVGLVVAVVTYIKRWIEGMAWYKPEYMTILGFVLGFLFAIPPTGFVGIVWIDFVAQGLGLGLVATGLYKTANDIARTVKSG
jgi:hypothetical protein